MEKYPSAKNVCPPNQSTNTYGVPDLGKDGVDPAVFLAKALYSTCR